MDSSDVIIKYFPGLTDSQIEAYNKLGNLYALWNSRINVISRRDIDNLYLHHVLHSLAIVKMLSTLADGTRLMDLGCGGGFPGIPLAIFYPEARFHLIDRIAKKVNVAREVAAAIGLNNVTFQHGDASECHEHFDYIVTRAVMPLDGLMKIARRNLVKNGNPANSMPPALIALKGGELEAEMQNVKARILAVPVSDFFTEEFFKTKQVVIAR